MVYSWTIFCAKNLRNDQRKIIHPSIHIPSILCSCCCCIVAIISKLTTPFTRLFNIINNIHNNNYIYCFSVDAMPVAHLPSSSMQKFRAVFCKSTEATNIITDEVLYHINVQILFMRCASKNNIFIFDAYT